MCGRFAQAIPPEILARFFSLESVPAGAPRYNIAPTQRAMAIRVNREGSWRATVLRWGLIPHWAKGPEIGGRLINARSETVFEKPAFRPAVERRRCIIPATGFFEWGPPGSAKRPFFIQHEQQSPLAMGGLWERWQAKPDLASLDTFTIITRPAPAAVAAIHHRCPLLLREPDFDLWLARDSSPAAIRAIVQQPPHVPLKAHAVSERVNKPAHDDPECIAPLPSEEGKAEG